MQSHASTLVLVLVILQSSLATFCNYTGGFANRSPGPCGSRTPMACDGALNGYANTRCCPSNTRCDISGDNAYCCSDPGDCASRVADAPKCADPGSKLWHFRDTPPTDSWCCDETYFGVAVFDSQGTFVAAACAPSAGRTLAPVTAGYFQTTATRPAASTCTGSGTVSKTPTDSAASNNTATQQHAAVLSKAGIAGIVVGCVAGVVLVGVASWFVLLFRRTPPRRQMGGAADQHSPGRGGAWTNTAPGSSTRLPLAELGAQRQDPVHELGT